MFFDDFMLRQVSRASNCSCSVLLLRCKVENGEAMLSSVQSFLDASPEQITEVVQTNLLGTHAVHAKQPCR